MLLTLGVHVPEGYCSCLCLSVSVRVCPLSHISVSVHPENTVTYSGGNGGQKICVVFTETAPMQRTSTPSVERHMYSPPFSCG